MKPGMMAAARKLLDAYLAGRLEDSIGPISRRLSGNEGDFDDDLPPLTPEQVVAAIAALHEVYCPDAESVAQFPAQLPPLEEGAEVGDDVLMLWRRALAWSAGVLEVGKLDCYDDAVLLWFKRQFRRFKLILTTAADANTMPSDHGGVA